jgi:Big-like domain-containing protein
VHAALATLVVLGVAAGVACSDNTSPNTDVIRVVLTPSLDTLQVGDTVRISFTPIDADGHQVQGLTVSLASEDPAIATVSSSELVQAISPGSTRISATTGSITDYALITVLQAGQDTIPTVASVLVTADRDTVTAGDSVLVHATPRDTAGNTIDGIPLTWASADTTIATVTDSGLVRTRAAGAAVISATADSATGSIAITVLAPSGAIARLRRRP